MLGSHSSTTVRHGFLIPEIFGLVNSLFHYFLARDAFLRTNRRAIAMMFVPIMRQSVYTSVRPSVWDGRAL